MILCLPTFTLLRDPIVFKPFFSPSALNRTMAGLAKEGKTLEDYSYEDKNVGRTIFEDMGDVKFNGISGDVAFSEATGDRIAWTKVEQLQGGK